jgi:hypothetical protein
MRDLKDLSAFDLWIGLDLANAPNLNVACLRIYQDTIYKTADMKLEYWTGDDWGQIDFGIGQSWNLQGFSGGSWQRWPAQFQTVWILRNGDDVWDSWEIDEFGMYDTTNCDEVPLTGDVIVSGYRGDHTGDKAVDGIIRTDQLANFDGSMKRNLDNYWMSGCGPCPAQQAYIGIDFGWERKQVKCFRIVQSPKRGAQSPTIELVYWDP